LRKSDDICKLSSQSKDDGWNEWAYEGLKNRGREESDAGELEEDCSTGGWGVRKT